MTYPFIPIFLIAIFAAVLVYFSFIKKDLKKIKTILYPGLFFIGIWAVMYYFLFK